MTAQELLERRLEDLSSRLLAVEALLASAYVEPEECRQHACTYYQHYLAYGPAELTHEGYHVAEKRCEEAQKRCVAYHNEHPDAWSNSGCCRSAECWEKLVRA